MTRAARAAREADTAHMARCLELAEQHRGRTAPNPIVGCVIVDARGAVIAEGAHRGPGLPHAEAAALAVLARRGKRELARGGTLYCNLEPCLHQGRTPPCVPPIKDAGLARVVVGSEDPIPEHGGGIESLRRAGISVSRALVDECDRANRPFLTWARYGRPAFTLKAAVTLDGKIATWAGNSKWITGDHARADAHVLRDRHDAVLVGANTVLADDPWLTARMVDGLRDPIRIVLDSQLRTPATARVLPRGKASARVILATTDAASAAKEKALVARGAEVWRCRAHANGRVRIDELVRRLGDEGITSVLVEGGGEVHASFLAARYADEVILYVAPRAVGGHGAPSWIGGKGVKVLSAAYEFEFEDMRRVGRDLRVTCAVRPPPMAE
jgi:diaminohydroxyphosphoribosylaminopyrimidine deaminase/5-amino-6-(5-phosphoribosylamino)uracil reductase